MKKTLYISLFLLVTQIAFSQNNSAEHTILITTAKIEMKNYDEAIQIISNAIAKNHNYKLYLKRAEAYRYISQNKKAIEDLERANLLKKACADFLLAINYAKIKDSKKSIVFLKKYLKKRDKLSETEIKLTPEFKNIENTSEWKQLWKGKFYSKHDIKLSEAKYAIKQEDFIKAYDLLFDLIKKSNIKHKAYELRGDLFIIEKEYKNAIKDYSQALKLKKNNLKYLQKRGEAYFYAKKYKKALKDFDKYLNKETNPKVIYKKAQTEFKLKNYNKSIENFNLFLNFYPQDINALYQLAKAFYQNGEYLSALENINICIEKDKSIPAYYNLRAEIYFATKLYKLATNDFSMSLDLNPNSGEIYYKKGNSEYKAGNFKTACTNWEKALMLKYYKATDMLEKYCEK